MLTVAIVVVLIIALGITGCLTGRWDDAQGEPDLRVPPSKYDNHIAELDKQAIEHAYMAQIEHLFSVWMKDATGQPERAVNGARTARKAFIGAMDALEKQQQQRLQRERPQ